MANEILKGAQGAVWGIGDPDSRSRYPKTWCWTMPLGNLEDGSDAEEAGVLQFEGETLAGLLMNAIRGLEMIGARGSYYGSSMCWRFNYFEIAMDNEAPCVTIPAYYATTLADEGPLARGAEEEDFIRCATEERM